VNLNNFFTELKQRSVYKVAVAYAVIGWLLVQVATQVFPFFEIPNWAVRLVVLVIVVGFPIALVIAWVFELTPDGLQRTEVAEARPARSGGRTWIYIVVVGALLSIGLFFAGRFTSPNKWGRAAGKSIAVLPFENLSEDKSNAYFADGMQDEIITRLAKIGELKVISRSSTERYRSKAENVTEIARQLGVAHLVEGSVQKVGERVRINVQLIDAQNDEHRWAELYDRNLTDIFAVQSELANRIAESLHATLTGAERKAVAEKPTNNLAAYDAYLRGLDLLSRPGQTEENQTRAADSFVEATKLDPQFALAWAALSQAEASLYFLQFDTSEVRKESARVAAENATRLNPSAIETLLANAYYHYHVERDYEGARLLFEKIQREAPSNSEALVALARIARRESRWNDSVRLYERAAKLNPRDTYLCNDRAWTFSMLRQFSATAEMIARALEIAPDDPEVLVSKVKLLQTTGDLTGARAVLAKIPPGATGGQAESLRVTQLLWEGSYDEAARVLESLIEKQKKFAPGDVYFYELTLGDARSLGGNKAGAQEAYLAAKIGFKKLQQEQAKAPFPAVGLALAEAGLGNKEAALSEGERAVSLLPAKEDPVFGPGMEESLAAVEAQVGEIDRAFARVERLLTTPYGAFPITVASLRLDPTWIPLRQHPRFKAIVDGPEPKTIYQ
jgi:TolB-like protein/Tfp pilus assembly protein PilF